MKNSINKKHHQTQRQADAPSQQNLTSPLPSRPQSPLQTSQGLPNDASADSDSRPNSPVPYRERHMSKPHQTKKKPKKVGDVHIHDNINNSKVSSTHFLFSFVLFFFSFNFLVNKIYVKYNSFKT